ncbi:aminopeptidase [Endozoicomonas sp. SM1973]|uniref:Aminopeptidase n=1 Tax=Spartinivicinus marinus TaxID=2994442 RepID=A0A853II89_9GAMM|nr:aminopeptidase [Spartinivicinus marinus]MCX4029602.1 aminopeptidase [Spartinivicinus marinus]NYZ68815.1 aminopeptidase [Spartinivicinus marinus]
MAGSGISESGKKSGFSQQRWLLTVIAGLSLPLCLLLAGCSEIRYYHQAWQGQWQLIKHREPVTELVDNEQTPLALKRQLQLAQQLTLFAQNNLKLPVNGNFQTFTDTKRPFVVWNVFAAPQFSTTPYQWCYPWLGCLSYRGYFAEQAAQQEANQLDAEGYDTYVAGIKAYSTLGWFDDPLLNTFIYYPELELANLIFHELTHRWLYVKDDVDFNESLATAVAIIGVEKWFMDRQPQAVDRLRQRYQFDLEFSRWLLKYRDQLEQLYQQPLSSSAMAQQKQQLLAKLTADYQQKRQQQWHNQPYYDHWISSQLNNAKLATVATYYRWVPALLSLYEQHQRDLGAFMSACQQLAQQPYQQRQNTLLALIAATSSSNNPIE